MNDIERRLADALSARASEVEPQDEHQSLERITKRVDMSRNRKFAVLGIAAAIFVVAGALALLARDNDDKQQVDIADNTTSTSTTTTTSTTSTTVVVPPFPSDAIWPFAGTSRSFDSPAAAALNFAIDYLGMTNARVGSTQPPADALGAFRIEIFPNDRASVRMRVDVRLSDPYGYVVLGANSDDIVVDSPRPHDKLTSKLNLEGTSLTFEGHVGVELRAFGSTDVVADTFVTGGGTERVPFSGSIDVPAVDKPLVLVMFEGDASGEQTYLTATVILLDAAS